MADDVLSVRPDKRNEWTPEFKALLERIIAIEARLRDIDYIAEQRRARFEYPSPAVSASHPPRPPARPASYSLPQALREMEITMILTALEQHKWVKTRAARALQITLRQLNYRMQQLGLPKHRNEIAKETP